MATDELGTNNEAIKIEYNINCVRIPVDDSKCPKFFSQEISTSVIHQYRKSIRKKTQPRRWQQSCGSDSTLTQRRRKWEAGEVYKLHGRHSRRWGTLSPVAVFVYPRYRRSEDISSIIERKWRSQSGRSRWHVTSFRVVVPRSRTIYSHSRGSLRLRPRGTLMSI